MDKDINKKEILYIGCGFYNYDKFIINELSKKANVTYIESGYYKHHYHLIYAIFTKILNLEDLFVKYDERYILRKLENIKVQRIDELLLIYGVKEPLSQVHFDYLLKRYPKIRFTLYLWDDWYRIDKKNLLLSNFERIFSFDTEDCKHYGFKHRPLFYVGNNKVTNKLYDIYHLGSCHNDRFNLMCNFKKIFKKEGLSYNIKLVIGVRPYFLAKYFKKDVYHENIDLLSPTRVDYYSYMSELSQARAIIDIPHPTQCGLTMRSIETLSLGVKLITTNKHIQDHLDIPTSMYYVLSGDGVESGLASFVKAPCCDKLPESYSLECFLETLLF